MMALQHTAAALNRPSRPQPRVVLPGGQPLATVRRGGYRPGIASTTGRPVVRVGYHRVYTSFGKNKNEEGGGSEDAAAPSPVPIQAPSSLPPSSSGRGGDSSAFREAFMRASVRAQDRATGVTRAQKLFARRLTVICFGAALIGEKVSGKGCVASLGGSIGVGLAQMEPEIILLAVLLAVAAFQPGLWPRRRADVEVWKWMGSSVEYIVDSLLCLAFSGSLIVEGVTGKGILAAVDFPGIGTPLTPEEATGAFLFLLFLTQGSDIFMMDPEE
eukprot:jgi/Tetstr1/423099/TSEL_013869.t1